MSARRDAALALAALLSFVALTFLVDASLSPPFLFVGGVGTVAFELLAARDPALVRRYWDRPAVQLATLAAALAGAAVGARVAPTSVLSALCGAVVTYLALLALVRTGHLPPLDTWR